MGFQNRRSPPVLNLRTVRSIKTRLRNVHGFNTHGKRRAVCAELSHPLQHPAVGPWEVLFSTFLSDIGWETGDKTRLMMNNTQRSDGQKEHPLCAQLLNHRGNTEGRPFVYPIFLSVLRGGSRGVCAKVPNNCHTFERLMSQGGSHPGLSPSLSPGLPLRALLQPAC